MISGTYSKKLLTSSLLLSMVLLCTNVYASEAVDIKTSVRNSFEYSPLLEDKAASVHKSENLVKSSRAAYFPTIGIWAEAGFAQEKTAYSREFESFDDPVAIGQVGFNVNYNIWSGGKTRAAVSSERANLLSTQYTLIDTANTLALSVISAHADILRYTQLVALAQKNVKEHKAILSILNQRLRDGLSTRGDVDQVYGRLYQTEATLLSYEKGLSEAQASYKRLTGGEIPENLVGLSSPSSIYTNVEELKATSLNNNYYLKKLTADIDLAEKSQKAINANKYPKVYASASSSYANKDTSGDTDILSWAARLNFEWEVFSGGAQKARSNAAKFDVLSAQKKLSEANDALIQQIESVFKHAYIAQEQAKLYSKASHSSKKARDNFSTQFKLGRKDLLSVLDAETASFSASASNVVSTTDAIIGHYHMHALAGTLFTALGLSQDVNDYLD